MYNVQCTDCILRIYSMYVQYVNTVSIYSMCMQSVYSILAWPDWLAQFGNLHLWWSFRHDPSMPPAAVPFAWASYGPGKRLNFAPKQCNSSAPRDMNIERCNCLHSIWSGRIRPWRRSFSNGNHEMFERYLILWDFGCSEWHQSRTGKPSTT